MLSDFGLSKVTDEGATLKTACGTPGYVGMDNTLESAITRLRLCYFCSRDIPKPIISNCKLLFMCLTYFVPQLCHLERM